MSERPARYHGLESFLETAAKRVPGDSEDSIGIQVAPQPGQLNLRGNGADPDFVKAVTRLLGQDLPVAANTMTIKQHRVYWLGPDEWLIVTPYDNTAEISSRMREVLTAWRGAATEVSGGNVVFRLAGRSARDVLAKGCTLDLRPEVFQPGACAQSGLAKAHVLIGLLDDAPLYEIIVRRSFSDYLALWLQSAAAEYGVRYTAGDDAVADANTR